MVQSNQMRLNVGYRRLLLKLSIFAEWSEIFMRMMIMFLPLPSSLTSEWTIKSHHDVTR